jgi:hypothetical protein
MDCVSSNWVRSDEIKLCGDREIGYLIHSVRGHVAFVLRDGKIHNQLNMAKQVEDKTYGDVQSYLYFS